MSRAGNIIWDDEPALAATRPRGGPAIVWDDEAAPAPTSFAPAPAGFSQRMPAMEGGITTAEAFEKPRKPSDRETARLESSRTFAAQRLPTWTREADALLAPPVRRPGSADDPPMARTWSGTGPRRPDEAVDYDTLLNRYAARRLAEIKHLASIGNAKARESLRDPDLPAKLKMGFDEQVLRSSEYPTLANLAAEKAMARLTAGGIDPATVPVEEKQRLLAEERALLGLPEFDPYAGTGRDLGPIENASMAFLRGGMGGVGAAHGFVAPSAANEAARNIQRTAPLDPKYADSMLLSKLPQGAGSMATFVAAAPLGAPAVATAGVLQGAGQARMEARAAGAGGLRELGATVGGGLIGATEAVPINRFMGRLGQAAGKSWMAKAATMGEAGIRGAIEEGLQEALSQRGYNGLARLLYDAKREFNEGVEESAVVGGVLGAVMNGVGATISRIEEAEANGTLTRETASQIINEIWSSPEMKAIEEAAGADVFGPRKKDWPQMGDKPAVSPESQPGTTTAVPGDLQAVKPVASKVEKPAEVVPPPEVLDPTQPLTEEPEPPPPDVVPLSAGVKVGDHIMHSDPGMGDGPAEVEMVNGNQIIARRLDDGKRVMVEVPQAPVAAAESVPKQPAPAAQPQAGAIPAGAAAQAAPMAPVNVDPEVQAAFDRSAAEYARAFPDAPRLEMVAPSRPDQAQAAEAAKRFGRKVAFFRGDERSNGFFDPEGDPRVIFVHESAGDALLAVVGHELTHSLVAADRAVAEELFEVVKGTPELKAEAEQYFEDAKAIPGLQEKLANRQGKLAEEGLARILGKAFSSQAFWDRLNQTPTLARKVIDAVKTIIRKLAGMQGPLVERLADIMQKAEVRLEETAAPQARQQTRKVDSEAVMRRNVEADGTVFHNGDRVEPSDAVLAKKLAEHEKQLAERQEILSDLEKLPDDAGVLEVRRAEGYGRYGDSRTVTKREAIAKMLMRMEDSQRYIDDIKAANAEWRKTQPGRTRQISPEVERIYSAAMRNRLTKIADRRTVEGWQEQELGLVARAQEGDADAAMKIVAANVGMIKDTAKRLAGGDQLKAAELAQTAAEAMRQTLMNEGEMVGKLGRFDASIGGIGNWLLRNNGPIMSLLKGKENLDIKKSGAGKTNARQDFNKGLKSLEGKAEAAGRTVGDLNAASTEQTDSQIEEAERSRQEIRNWLRETYGPRKNLSDAELVEAARAAGEKFGVAETAAALRETGLKFAPGTPSQEQAIANQIKAVMAEKPMVTGDPTLANPGLSDESRAAARMGQAVSTPQTETDAQRDARAQAILKNPQQADSLWNRVRRGEVLTDPAEVRAYQDLLTSKTQDAFSGKGSFVEVIESTIGWRRGGSEQAKAFRARHDRIQSPAQRAADFLQQLMTPPDHILDEIEEDTEIVNGKPDGAGDGRGDGSAVPGVAVPDGGSGGGGSGLGPGAGPGMGPGQGPGVGPGGGATSPAPGAGTPVPGGGPGGGAPGSPGTTVPATPKQQAAQRRIDRNIRDWAAKARWLARKIKRQTGVDIANLTPSQVRDLPLMVRLIRKVQAEKGEYGKMLYEWWINSILGSFTTQIVNLSGSMVNLTAEAMFRRPAQAAINALTGGKIENAPTFVEARSVARGLASAVLHGARNAVAAFRSGSPVLELEVGADPIDKLEGHKPSIPGRAGEIIRLPTKVLIAVDEFFKGVIGHLEAYAQADRAGRRQGLSGQQLDAFVDKQVADMTSEAWQAAVKEAERLTFQSELGKIGKAFQHAKQVWHETMSKDSKLVRRGARAAGRGVAKMVGGKTGVKAGQAARVAIEAPLQLAYAGARAPFNLAYHAPFVKTLINVFKQGFSHTPLSSPKFAMDLIRHGVEGMAKMKQTLSSAELLRRGTEQLLGFMTFTVLMAMDDDEEGLPLITGTHPYSPKNRTERDTAYRVAPPTSIRLPGTKLWLDYSRLEPAATSLGVTVDLANAFKAWNRGKNGEEVWGKFFQQVVGQVKDKTFAQGITRIMDAVQSDKGATEWLANFAASFMPNIVRSTARAGDPYIREHSVGDIPLVDAMLKRMGYQFMPSAGNAPPPKVDVWGRDVIKGEEGPVGRVMLPWRTRSSASAVKWDKVLYRHNQTAKDEWNPDKMDRVIRVRGGESYSMNDREYYLAQKLAGATAQALLDASNIDRLPEAEQVEYIKKAITASRRAARAKIMQVRAEDVLE